MLSFWLSSLRARINASRRGAARASAACLAVGVDDSNIASAHLGALNRACCG